jgi:hypothetical protein
MWILSETEIKDQIVTPEWIADWVQEKGVTFKVMRDFHFWQVYGAIKPASSALPHQYILDASTMELIDAFGGINKSSEDALIAFLESGIEDEE